MNTEQAFFEDFFAHLAEQGWQAITLPSIARATGTPLTTLLKSYTGKYDVLLGFGRYLDRCMAENYTPEDAPLKDRLFDLVMNRFDLLKPFRAGLVRLMEDMQAHPAAALVMLCESFLCRRQSAQLMLELAGAPHTYAPFIVLRAGFELAYLQALRTWKKDESADLAATMASLDRALDRLLRFTRLL